MNIKDYKGLTDKDVISSREENGFNELTKAEKESLIIKIIEVFKEPMFILLLIAASVYFIVGEYIDGCIMLIFILATSLTEFFQEEKTDKALEELNKLSSLNVKVIRNNTEQMITSDEVVVGDIVVLEEGDTVPADGIVLYSQSLGINESSLTGESNIIYKNTKEDNTNHFKLNMCYSQTTVTNGMGIIEITNVGKNTEVGKIGNSLNKIKKEKTPLEKQVNKLAFVCTIISSIFFIITIVLNFINYSNLDISKRLTESILAGVTVAMATIPEEIPVVLTIFLAMGAWHLTKEKTLTRNIKSIETLGSINVLCTDKTGTITENKMTVKEIYEYNKTLLESSYKACPNIAYDSMEIAIKDYCQNKSLPKEKDNITKEYAFTPETKMMGQIWNNKELYVKGAYESILPLCNLNKEDLTTINNKIKDFSIEGYRIIAVAKNNNLKNIPKNLNKTTLSFEGLIALEDSPRKGIVESLTKCYSAGIRVIMITGDSGDTAKSIAKKINLQNYNKVITGIELEKMSDEELIEEVKTTNIFARVYPNHKMRIVNALQKNNKIVAMTGDGVNDAPALKKANIGIAMGERGTNVAKEAADIILLDDNFNTIVKSITNGRTIYKNIRKAISYIIAIHIPIALLSLTVPLFKLPTFITPIHVMLLELLIDPTSSLIFQKIETTNDIMQESPRNIDEPLLNSSKIIKSIMQGFLIFIIVFITYIYLLKTNTPTTKAITIAYSTLVLSSILLPFQLRNKELTIINLIKKLTNKTILIINSFIIILLIAIIYIPFFNNIANTTSITIYNWFVIILLSLIAVLPFDLQKIKSNKV